jgi:hypothetical protein
MAHTEYTVQQGDCISSIAYEHGFFADAIWNDPKNSQLKRERKNPNVLKPGDVVYIPELEARKFPAACEKRHRFKLKGVPEKLKVQFKEDGEPRAGEAYVLTIDGAPVRGKTDGEGRIVISIPPNAQRGIIRFVESGAEYRLKLGHLDPITEISGIQGRLRNLGFYSGPQDGKMCRELTRAIEDFQAAQEPKEEPTGTLDDETRQQIQEAYGG